MSQPAAQTQTDDDAYDHVCNAVRNVCSRPPNSVRLVDCWMVAVCNEECAHVYNVLHHLGYEWRYDEEDAQPRFGSEVAQTTLVHFSKIPDATAVHETPTQAKAPVLTSTAALVDTQTPTDTSPSSAHVPEIVNADVGGPVNAQAARDAMRRERIANDAEYAAHRREITRKSRLNYKEKQRKARLDALYKASTSTSTATSTTTQPWRAETLARKRVKVHDIRDLIIEATQAMDSNTYHIDVPAADTEIAVSVIKAMGFLDGHCNMSGNGLRVHIDFALNVTVDEARAMLAG